MLPIVLASGSQYRADLLRKLQLEFICCTSHVDETPLTGETAEQLARRLSLTKAQAISAAFPQHLIIGSDQVAVCGEEFLHKPGSREQAIQQLRQQSGRIAQFYTGVCVLNSSNGQSFSDIDLCKVHFKPLSEPQIIRYLDLEQPFDCAGSFKSEGLGIALFSRIEGDDPNALIGLPLIKLIGLLKQFAVEII
jgi:MAF protein